MLKRFKINELSCSRICSAVARRLQSVPDRFQWEFGTGNNHDFKRSVSELKNIHSGKRCFIIANGPSLKSMDLSCLKNEYTMSMNRAYLLYNDWGFIPTYYACINELVLEQFHEDISKLQMIKFLNYNRRHLFDIQNEINKFIYFSLSIVDKFNSDLTKPICSGGTVTYACLQIAYYLGFKEVILIGLDHNFAEKGTPNKTEVRLSEKDESHCHPDYFPKGIKWQLPDLLRSEVAYQLSRNAYELDNRKIYDATVGGKCTVFEKKEFSTFFKRS